MTILDPLRTLEQAVPFLVVFIVCYVFARRWRLRKRGFRGSCSHVGIALQQLQAMACPQVEHAVEEQAGEKGDEDDSGGPDDPTRYYRRLRERIDREHPRNALKSEGGTTKDAQTEQDIEGE